MKANDIEFVPIVPVDDMTNAMLAYAQSAQGRAKIDEARQQLRQGRGLTVTAEYFDGLNRRISERTGGSSSIEA